MSLLLCNKESVNKRIKTRSHVSFGTRNVSVWLTNAKKWDLATLCCLCQTEIYIAEILQMLAYCNVSKPWAESRIKPSLNYQESLKRKQKLKNLSENHLLTLVHGEIQNSSLG